MAVKGKKLGEIFSTTVAGDHVTAKVVKSEGPNLGCKACAFLNTTSEGDKYCQRPAGISSCIGRIREDKETVVYKEMTCYNCSDKYYCWKFKDYESGERSRLPETCEYFRERYVNRGE